MQIRQLFDAGSGTCLLRDEATKEAVNPRPGNGTSREDFVAIMDALELQPPKRIDVAVPGNLGCGLKQQG